MSEVIPGAFRRQHLQELCDQLKEVIHAYDGRTSLAEVLGVLEIVKHELIAEHQ